MPVKTIFTTREQIIHTPLPTHGDTYTVIPHEFIINKAKQELSNAGFVIKHELYKSTQNGQVAQGMYHLDHTVDPDMGMMFAWSNSYDKSRRFKCAVGGHVFVCMNGVVRGDMASYSRKHTGDADQEASDTIDYQVSMANRYFSQLVDDKNLLFTQQMSRKAQAELIGRLFLEEKVITLTQMGIIKREMENPSYMYSSDPDSAWTLYNHVTHALKDSHPERYLDDHEKVHNLFMSEFTNKPVQKLLNPEPEFSFEKRELVESIPVRRSSVVFV